MLTEMSQKTLPNATSLDSQTLKNGRIFHQRCRSHGEKYANFKVGISDQVLGFDSVFDQYDIRYIRRYDASKGISHDEKTCNC